MMRLAVAVTVLSLATGVGIVLSLLTDDHPRSAGRWFAIFAAREAGASYCVTEVFTSDYSGSYPPRTRCSAPGGWWKQDGLTSSDSRIRLTQYTLPDSGWYCQSGQDIEELCYPDPYFNYEEEDLDEENEATPTDQDKTQIARLLDGIVAVLDVPADRTYDSTYTTIHSIEDFVPPTPVFTLSERRIANEDVTCLEQDWDFREPFVVCFTRDGIEAARYDTDFTTEAVEIKRGISLDEFELPYPTTTGGDPRIVEY